jgi:hypothetical protein
LSRYRCTTCREYFRQPPYRRLGIVSVCSETCLHDLSAKSSTRNRTRPADIPEETRASVRDRDRHRCRFCGRTDNLHDHHIHYRSERVDHSADNLILLCLEHHDVVHSDKGRWQPVCLAYISELGKGRQRYLVEIDREINGRGAASSGHPDPTADPG